jgi:hypothetical protein
MIDCIFKVKVIINKTFLFHYSFILDFLVGMLVY